MDAPQSSYFFFSTSTLGITVFVFGIFLFIICIILKRTIAKPNIDKLKDLPLLWAWALNALLNDENRDNHFIYSGSYKNKWVSNHKAHKKLLEQWWGIDNKYKAIDMIEALIDAHIDNPPLMEKARPLLEASPEELIQLSKNTDKITAVLIDNIEHIRQHGFIAWDYVRAQGIIGWAYQANYFDLEEARIYALKAALKTQRAFSSWKEMATNYCIGYYCWMGEEKLYRKKVRSTQHLLTHSNSPWVIFDWNMNLKSKIIEPII